LAPSATNSTPVISLTVDDNDATHGPVTATPVDVIISANQAPTAGGQVTASTPSNANGLVSEDVLTTVRIAPTTLSNPDGPVPTQLRILSIEGGTLTALDDSPIVM